MTVNQTFDWQGLAACIGKPSSYFFDDEEGIHARDEYEGLCKRCPVRSMCLEDAIVYNYDGVWGGMTERQRRAKYPEEYRQHLIEERREMGDYLELRATG